MTDERRSWAFIGFFVIGALAGLGIGWGTAATVNDPLETLCSSKADFYEISTGACMTEDEIHIRAGHMSTTTDHEHS